MIISASFRTDIPAFYGEWFRRRLDAGYCLVRNPYSGNAFRVDLRRHLIDGFFFWTKNLGPFLPRLAILKERGYPFVVLYSITGYPRELEVSVVSAARAVEHMRLLAEEYGPKVPVWRYDPIAITSLTDFDWHRRNFEKLCRNVAGITDGVVISFAEIYKKTERNMNEAARQHNFTWENPGDEKKRAFIRELNGMALAYDLRLSLCAQRPYLSEGVSDARCMDGDRLSQVSGFPVKTRTPGHRGKQCACHESRDIGSYDTCPHGCAYCYAVRNRKLARDRYRKHDPRSEYLFE